LKQLGIRAPYFVYVGGIIPRKRLDWALEIFRRIKDGETQMAVCGVGSESENIIRDKLEPELRDRVIILPFVSEESMPALLRHAVAMLYPTLYEGFGYPAVESQAVGTPVLFSRVGSLTELEGPGACVLPTDDLESWVQTCRTLLEQRRDNPQANEKARRWAQKFSWDESARQHLNIYESVSTSK
jgi:glycosyltransferase involved in cell wall biosynthesis